MSFKVSDYGGWPLHSRHCCCCHSNKTWVYNYICANGVKKLLFYCYLHCITVCLPSPKRSWAVYANFHPPEKFLIMTVFRSCMHIYVCSLMLIFQYLLWPSSFCSVSSCPYQRECCCNSSEETKPEQPSICCCANSLRYGCKLTRGKSSSDCRRSASTEIQCQTLFSRLIFFQLVTFVWMQARPFPFCSTNCVLDTGSNWRCRKERVCLVELSQQ